jgi:hypothetical protein
MMEDGGRIKGLFFFNILYHSMAVYECFQICSFFSFLVRCFSCILYLYLGAPFCVLMEFIY